MYRNVKETVNTWKTKSKRLLTKAVKGKEKKPQRPPNFVILNLSKVEVHMRDWVATSTNKKSVHYTLAPHTKPTSKQNVEIFILFADTWNHSHLPNHYITSMKWKWSLLSWSKDVWFKPNLSFSLDLLDRSNGHILSRKQLKNLLKPKQYTK